MAATVYLIPSLLAEDGLSALPSYVLAAVRDCQVFFAENERTTRRYFKQLWKEMVIDEYTWYTIGDETTGAFRQCLKEGKNIGIVSEAGCPGVADPGQALVAIAQDARAVVRPLVGPSSILLSLMASGLNGQQFRFNGYLPIDTAQRVKTIRELEAESARKNCTQIFIETPYRNNQLLEALLKTCQPATRLCVAANITSATEKICTKKISEWQQQLPELHKKPVIFLLLAD